ncbi:hypothetical protein DPMN_039129 [Dreissena polymorpha]|uniref:Uncharacterized protein n=1 Tax=Dreissena polymorpha TaxID=45954 RepID=A0A9D4RPA7_DREPO|nr:hypothetical protein DPMN_039129 [Dreissena polymorpha]
MRQPSMKKRYGGLGGSSYISFKGSAAISDGHPLNKLPFCQLRSTALLAFTLSSWMTYTSSVSMLNPSIGTNVLTKFNVDQPINVAIIPPLDGHFFKEPEQFLKFSRDIIRTNYLAKFGEEWAVNQLEKNALQPGSHVFQRT